MSTKKRRTGNIYKRGNVFWLRYMIDGRLIQRSLETSDRDEAEKRRKKIMRPLTVATRVEAALLHQAELTDAAAEQTAVDLENNPPLTWADAWPRYEAATNRPDSSETTLNGYQSIWKRFTRWITQEHPEKKVLRDIDAVTATEYAQRLNADGSTASTFNQHIGFLRLLWRVLAKPIRSDGNPWMDIQKRRLQKLAHRRRAVTPEQLDKILEAAVGDPDLRDLLYVLAWTGQRRADGVFLRWDAIDFKRLVVTVYPRKTARYGKVVFIPLLPQLAEMLQRRRRKVNGEFVFPQLVRDYTRDKSAITKRIQKVFKSAGLETQTTRQGIARAITVYGAHSLRHFYATQALAAGVPFEIVKRITGHTSDAMLEGYEHVDAAMIGALADRLSNDLANSRLTLPVATITTRHGTNCVYAFNPSGRHPIPPPNLSTQS